MYMLMVLAFVLGYALIALEHPLNINKAASALLTGVVCWVLLVLGWEAIMPAAAGEHGLEAEVLHHVGEIAQILFFLLGAMTIVELIDAHDGFQVITSRITTRHRTRLMWIIVVATFFFSALLDNLTTAIVMGTLLKKMIGSREDLWLFAGMVIIAANAGGAWSPIGDVTTIMLWIAGKVTTLNIIVSVFLPSVVCLLVPAALLSLRLKGEVDPPAALAGEGHERHTVTRMEQKVVFGLGVAGLLFVPVFKNLFHLPPFMGMLFSLGVLWLVTEILHRRKEEVQKSGLSVAGVIRRIDTPSILFFLGILLAVASLQTAGHLRQLATYMDDAVGDIFLINGLIGLLSAIVDNVPLVAGAMGMYPEAVYPVDHTFWELLAYCAGTGGSVLIIGSAAGVAIMGILRIDFLWYLKRLSGLALAGYLAGLLVYWLMN